MFAASDHDVADRPVVLVTPDLRPSILGVAQSLEDAGLLRRLVTTLAVDQAGNGDWLTRLVRRFGGRFQSALASRQVPAWLGGRVETYPARETLRVAAQRLGLGPITCDRIWEWAETGFDRRVARAWAGQATCLYGCEHASVETFRRHKARGGLTVLWQVIAHHGSANRLFQEALEQAPDSMTPYARHALRSADRINARKDEQYDQADLIVANSDFVRQTFLDAGVGAEKVVAVPTGCPPVAADQEPAIRSGPPVFLSAGSQSVRKGSHLLLEAWRRLQGHGSAKLWLIGKMELPQRLLDNLPSSVEVRPPVARAQMHKLFQQADVLVLPTLCEGRAHIILEAVAHGLPVITTANSGCTDLVQDGVNGWVVPVGDSEALAQRLVWCLEHRTELAAMGAVSLEHARRWQVADFSAAHAGAVRRFLEQRGVLVPPREYA
jgi:glycosyltransferase involved in cell wall biosynthesis